MDEFFSGDGPEAPGTPQYQPVGAPVSRRAMREAEEASRAVTTEHKRGWVGGVVVIALVLALGAAVWVWGIPMVKSAFGGGSAATTSQDYGPDEAVGEVEVTIESGDPGATMAKKLYDAGVVGSEKAFLNAFAANSRSGEIQPGVYALQQKMNAAAAVRALLDETRRRNIVVTIPEGYRASQIFDKLAEATGKPVEEFAQAAADAAAIGLPEQAGGKAEGWLFPATYSFMPETAPTVMVKAMVDKTKQVLSSLKIPEDKWNETIIGASILEKETKRAEDRPKAARVILNRLSKGMRLQLDSTVAYGAGHFESVWSTDEDLAKANDYNTYQMDGLPKGAICNPGKATIQAWLKPEEGPWLYFMPINLKTGETVFCEDQTCHAAAQKQLSDWEKANPGDY